MEAPPLLAKEIIHVDSAIAIVTPGSQKHTIRDRKEQLLAHEMTVLTVLLSAILNFHSQFEAPLSPLLAADKGKIDVVPCRCIAVVSESSFSLSQI